MNFHRIETFWSGELGAGDFLTEAGKRAEMLHISLGKAVPDLVRRGLQAAPPVIEAAGLAIFDPPEGSPKITARQVKEALNDFP